jgi:phosphoribosylaminoimidazole (AIR) synthetase
MIQPGVMKIEPNPVRGQRYDPARPMDVQLSELVRRTANREGCPLNVREDGVVLRSDYFKGRFEYRVTHDLGTKGMLHWMMRDSNAAAEDPFALATNSSIEKGAVPIEMMFRMMMPERNDEMTFGITQRFVELAESCSWGIRGDPRRYPIIIGVKPEISVFETLDGLQVSAAVSGYCREKEDIPKIGREGSVLIGIESSGAHCMAVALLREEFSKRCIALNSPLGKDLATPTLSYLMPIKRLMYYIDLDSASLGKVNEVIDGMVHVHSRDWKTDGGFIRFKELLGGKRNLDVVVRRGHSLKPQSIFQHAHSEFGIAPRDMYRWFNNGIGYVISIKSTAVELALSRIRDYRLKADVIGVIQKGRGRLVIESQYDGSTLEY